MTNNQPQFTIAELGAKFGSQIAQIFYELITLEKVIESQRTQIEALTKAEARLQGHIQELEAQMAKFTRQEYDFVDHIQTLESELNMMKTANPDRIFESAEIAFASKEGDGNKKAAPIKEE